MIKNKNYLLILFYKEVYTLCDNDIVIGKIGKSDLNCDFKISRPVNKSLDKLIKKNIKRKTLKNKKANATNSTNQPNNNDDIDNEGVNIPGITVMVSTIRSYCLDNVFDNYVNQNYEKKELIIVLNKNSMDRGRWKRKFKNYSNIRIYQLDERTPFSECYNFCVDKAKYNYISCFDDDDYYAPNYLNDTVNAFAKTNADVVGKKCRFIYFDHLKLLTLTKPKNENKYVDFVDGPTTSFNKRVFKNVRFKNLICGIDRKFCKDCLKHGYKIYSNNRFNHAYIRYSNSHNHTWRVSDRKLLSWCTIIGKMDNFKEYVTN